jgi:GNAT superfamily N-acetyltransferase
MAGSLTVEGFGLGDPRIREFALFPWTLYHGDPLWTPPLNADLLGSRLLGVKGLLTAENEYHRNADVWHFIARRDGRAVGTVSAAVNRRFNEHYDAKIGFFGFFEVENDAEAGGALLDAARDWLRERGMTVMRGPGQYSCATHERQGVLVDGFEFPPTVELTHNPQYYAALMDGYGMGKAKDYVAYHIDVTSPPPDRLARIADGVRRRGHVTSRPADMTKIEEEVRLIVHIYNRAWADNWGFLPITDADADTLVESLKPIVDPGLIRFGYMDGEIAAVLGALPDPYWALRPRWKWYGDSDLVRLARLMAVRRHIPRVRLMFFGVVPEHRQVGVDALLFDEVMRYGRPRGYTECEPSMMLEDNVRILRPSTFMGGSEYKRWRIYEMPIG